MYSEESSKSEDEDNFGVDWEGELIIALKDLKKSRKYNKSLKEQIEMEKEKVKQIGDMHEDLKKPIEAKEEELLCGKIRIEELEENECALEKS